MKGIWFIATVVIGAISTAYLDELLKITYATPATHIIHVVYYVLWGTVLGVILSKLSKE